MPRIAKPLTDSQITRSKPGDKEYKLNDGAGLSLRVRVSGKKDWIYRYKIPFSDKRNDISFGSYPTVSLADARVLRSNAKELLTKDIDPKNNREQIHREQKLANSNTLLHSATSWFEVKRSKISPSYADDVWRSLELHIFPSLGKVPITLINAVDTIDVIKPTAAKGSLETVKRLCQRLNEIMIFAVNTGLAQNNPLAGINHAFESPVETNMPTLKPEQLSELMKALNTARIKIVTRCLIEWQLHTMVRPSEAAGAKWCEIDFDNSRWLIPAERMKKKRAHVVPLTEQTMELLSVIKPISGHRVHIFPGDRQPTKHCNESTANMALKRMGFKNILVAHGMRALASTTLNEQGFDKDVIEAALAHSDKDQVRAAYNRATYLDRRRVMMKWWSEHIEQAATGNTSLSSVGRPLRLVNRSLQG
jgi:integrase